MGKQECDNFFSFTKKKSCCHLWGRSSNIIEPPGGHRLQEDAETCENILIPRTMVDVFLQVSLFIGGH